jgi:hypothetical protein
MRHFGERGETEMCRILVGRPVRNRQPGEDNIKVYLKEIGYENVG